MCEKFLLLFQRAGKWQCSNHCYNAPVGITHGVRRLQKDFNYATAQSPITLFRAIHVVINPETGVETSGLYKEYAGDC